ncbi:MAG TPA: Ig-like domain-containing protein [Planctomycetota bacterium]|nr:Ig-like domain-containing protein [Planctomycetota bacterium]
MRHLGILCLLLAVSSVGYGRAAATVTEFYVDPDFNGSVQNGQAATPWSTLGGGSGAAWAAINQALAAGDVTIYFSARQAGSDTNDAATWELYLYRTNTSSTRLTLDGMSRYNTNDLNPSWQSYSGSSRFQITGGYPISTYDVTAPQNYVTIRGFRVISTGGQLLQYGRGGSHVVIENNEFSAASSAVIGAGVGFGDAPGSKDLTIRNNVIHDTFGEAIYIGGNSYTVGSPTNLDGVLVENNHIYSAGRWGGEGDCIDLKAGLANVIVRNNVCHDNVGTTNVNGITSLSPLTAEGNVVYNLPGGKGITFGASGVIVKNIILNTNSCGIYACDDAGKPVHTSITNNTVYNCGSGLCLGNLDTASTFEAINNLITHCPGGGMGGWLPSSGTGTFTIKYNDVVANGGTNYGYPEKYFVDATDLSVDPLYVNPANPAGPDGKYFSADDGLALQAASPIAKAGEGGTCIGALPVAGSTSVTPPPPPPPTPDPTPADTSGPSLAFVSPADGQRVSGKIEVGITASDPSGVQRVEFSVNGTLKTTLYGAPWSFTLNTKHYREKTMTLTAKGFDTLGNHSSTSITLIVR